MWTRNVGILIKVAPEGIHINQRDSGGDPFGGLSLLR